MGEMGGMGGGGGGGMGAMLGSLGAGMKSAIPDQKKYPTGPSMPFSSLIQDQQPKSPGSLDSGPTGQMDPGVMMMLQRRLEPSAPRPSGMDLIGRFDQR